MATSVASSLASPLRAWHQTEHPPGLRPTLRDSSISLMGSMARLPSASEPMGGHISQKPRLPSFSNFLSGAGRPDLNFAPPSPGPNRGGSRPPPLSQSNSQQPSSHHLPQTTIYGPSDQNLHQHSEQLARQHSTHAAPNQSTFWPHASSNSFERSAVAPPPHISHPSALEHGSGRIVVGERIIPGKGVCYVYDDGSMCQKIINGDAVNPKWGTTKAGKPRKRLGQACNTCREKKIKCDPSVPKCAQCQKFGRECKFETTNRSSSKQPHNGQSSSSTTSTEQPFETLSPRRGSSASTDLTGQEQGSSKEGQKSSMPVESLLSPASIEESIQADSPDALPPAKKARFSTSPRPASEVLSCEGASNESMPGSMSSPVAMTKFSWKVDPYEVDRELTLYLLNKYFSHIGCATDCTIPRKPFIQWVVTCAEKSSADLMLIYAMLAMGARFTRRADFETHQAFFTDVVHDAVLKNGDSFSLQLVHTRLILALIAFSQGQYNRAFEYSGSARITACGLNYNMEEGVCAVTTKEELVFGFDRPTLIECRRRTFWTAYIMECFNGCCSASVRAMYRSDCHLRLPCDQSAFERGVIPLTSFDLSDNQPGNSGLHKAGQAANVGLLGYLVEMATIFNEVVSRISRAKTRFSDEYNPAESTFSHDIMVRLKEWEVALKKYMGRNMSSADSSEPVSGLHILYHYTAMMVHRHIRHTGMDSPSVHHHVGEAYKHAQGMVRMVRRLSNEDQKDAPMVKLAAQSPFSGFAVTAALDTITAAGTLYDLMQWRGQAMSSISTGLEVLDRLTDHWQSARQQRELIKDRLKVLLNATKRASDFNGAWYFGEPMQSPFGLDQDIIYGLPRMRYFQALDWVDRIHNDGDFHRLDGEDDATSAM